MEFGNNKDAFDYKNLWSKNETKDLFMKLQKYKGHEFSEGEICWLLGCMSVVEEMIIKRKAKQYADVSNSL